jgi:hypothetical protein
MREGAPHPARASLKARWVTSVAELVRWSRELRAARLFQARRLSLWAWLAVALGIALRLFRPTRHSLWHDEGVGLTLADGSLSEVLGRLVETRNSEHFQPLFFLLLQPWLRVSNSDLGLKALVIGLSALALVAIHRCATRLIGKRAGTMATVFFALSAFQVYYAQEVRPYALISLVTVLQLWGYSLVRRQGCDGQRGTRRSAAFAAINGLAVLVSLFQAFFLFVLSVSDLILTGGSDSLASRLHRWIARWAASAAATVPAMAFFLLLGPSGAETGVPRELAHPLEGLLYSGFGLLFGSTLGPPPIELRGDGRLGALLAHWPALSLSALTGAGLALAVVRPWSWSKRQPPKSERETTGWVLTLATALGLLLFLLFAWATGIQLLPRHCSFLSPLLALVAGFHLTELMLSSRRRRVALGVSVSVCLLLLNLWSLESYFFDDRHLKDDYRSVGRLLATNPEVPALMVWGSVPLVRRYGAVHLWGFSDLRPSSTLRELRQNIGPGEEVFLLVNRPYYWSDRPIESLVSGYDVIERIDLPGFEIYRLRGSNSLGESGLRVDPRPAVASETPHEHSMMLAVASPRSEERFPAPPRGGAPLLGRTSPSMQLARMEGRGEGGPHGARTPKRSVARRPRGSCRYRLGRVRPKGAALLLLTSL